MPTSTTDTPCPPLNMLHPSAIRRMTGFPVSDADCAFIPELMARPDLAERALRQGVTLLSLRARGVLGALVFKDRLFSFLRLPFGPEFLRSLNDTGSASVWAALRSAAPQGQERRDSEDSNGRGRLLDKEGAAVGDEAGILRPCPGAQSKPDEVSRQIEVLLGILEDFRLGWLPQEKAHSLGGYVWRPEELPAEAEGFAPIFATGPLARCMHGHARILSP